MRVAYPEMTLGESLWTTVEAQTPPQGRLVRYRTAYYQMIGYLDLLGRWVGLDGMAEELPVQSWRELQA